MTLQLEGAELIVLAPPRAAEAIEWLLLASPRPDAVPEGLRWAVAQAADTFVWGVYTGQCWKWATQDADREARAPCRETLLEVRAFSAEAELLLWRAEKVFAGRILRDAARDKGLEVGSSYHATHAPIDRRSYFLPARDEEGFLTGYISKTADPDFLWRQEGNGRTTVTPTGMGVLLRNYMEQCQDTGMIRIAATRFHSIFEE